MIALILLSLAPSADAVERERVLDIAAEFATHEWTMTAANETVTCSSSWSSDYTPGTWVGIPYDWGGWVTTAQYDDYLEQGYGAGSHSWHGVLSCTVGVDCSGFVSQTWETSSKYGTSTFYAVTEDIAESQLARGDALNDPGSHIVLYAYETAAGVPVHYEANGGVVFVDSDQGWSAFSGYTPIRYDEIEDGPTTGTFDAPIVIDGFPLSHLHWTAGAASDEIDAYSCAPDTDESGPEIVYHLTVASEGDLHLTLSDDSGVDIDIHVLDAPDGAGCLARDDREIEITLSPGEYWITADTYVSGYEYPGPYLLSGTFSGELGALPGGGDDPGGAGGDTGSPEDPGDGDGDPSDPDPGDQTGDGLGLDFTGPPGDHVVLSELGGCAVSAAPAAPALVGLALLVGLARRRRDTGSR